MTNPRVYTPSQLLRLFGCEVLRRGALPPHPRPRPDNGLRRRASDVPAAGTPVPERRRG
jgi:hypothetical protein